MGVAKVNGKIYVFSTLISVISSPEGMEPSSQEWSRIFQAHQ